MKPQPCIAGIDGGGTKSHILLYNAQMEKIGEAFSGTTNLCAADESLVETNLRRLFARAEESVGARVAFQAIALGTAGVSRTDAVDKTTEMLQRITGCTAVTVVGDMELPLYAYAPDKNAVILIAGTGSVCYGRTAEGHTARSGGWGHLFGDEGGAYWLACRGLDACLRAYDGRTEQAEAAVQADQAVQAVQAETAEQTKQAEAALTRLILAHFACASPVELVSLLYGRPFDKSVIAGAAVCVGEAAKQGAPAAKRILREAVNELLLMVKATAKAMTTPEVIILSGSVLLKNTIIQDALCARLAGYYPDARIIIAEAAGDGQNAVSAAWGAVRLAAKSIGWA